MLGRDCPRGHALRGFLITLVVGAFLFNITPVAQAITFGVEIRNASTSYPDVISIWQSDSPDSAKQFLCTGNLISSTVVLTAAHCVLSASEGYLYVAYGADRLDGDITFSDVSASWRDPRYSKALLVNDVGLLLLATPLVDVKYKPLPSAAVISSAIKQSKGKYEIAGWGVDQNGDPATYLKHAYVTDQTSVEAGQKFWNNNVWIAIGKYNKTERIYSGACNGDSGGPLYALTGKTKVLIGVTSWGSTDCELAKPSVYTRLSHYLSDIRLGIAQLKINAKTDNRLPPPVFTTQTTITGIPSADSWKANNTLTCNPAQAGPNDSITMRWYWDDQSTISTNPILNLSIDALKSRLDFTQGAAIYCETTARGPGGLVSADSTSAQLYAYGPPLPSVVVTKNYDPGWSFLSQSECHSTEAYPNEIVKWIVTSDASFAYFGDSKYPADAVFVGTGRYFNYTKANIVFMRDKVLLCAIERSNAVGTVIGASESAYIWSTQVDWFLAH